MSRQEIVIDPAFEGPPSSGHGGYTCGVLAPYLADDAEITLRGPVPLGTGLSLVPTGGGLSVRHGDDLVAECASTRLEDRTPPPPTLDEALSASFPGRRAHPFPRCVVCGTDRTDAAALRIFPGPLPSREVVAAVWRPGDDVTIDGVIRPEFVWAALDCPGGWAASSFGRVEGPAVLGRMAARLVPSIVAQAAHIVVGWLEGRSGRKLTAGSALYSRVGVLQAFSRQTWIVLR